MKTFEAMENKFYISSMQKTLSARGSTNSETVCFSLNRYAGKADLAECCCTIKTKNCEGKSDLVIPEVAANDKKLNVLWTLSSGATNAVGALFVQIQFEKIFDDSTKNIVWQSNIMEFEIPDSLDAADEIIDQKPTLFQQWEEKVNTLYLDVAADVQSMQALQSQAQVNADTAKMHSDAAAVSAQSAQTSAQNAQQKVDCFSGYTKAEIDNSFANALIGEATGQCIKLDDVQPNTYLRFINTNGQTTETVNEPKSPDRPSVLTGATSLTVTDSNNLSQTITWPQPLYSLPNGTADCYDPIKGTGMQYIHSIPLPVTNWTIVSSYFDSNLIGFSCHPTDRLDLAPVFYCNKFPIEATGQPSKNQELLWYASGIGIAIFKYRLTGWNESLTNAQKTALFTNWLANNPVMAFYKMNKPIPIYGTPNNVPANSSTVTISTNGSSITAGYVKDINKVIQKLQEKISS